MGAQKLHCKFVNDYYAIFKDLHSQLDPGCSAKALFNVLIGI